jgi:DNA-binding GntR family transcriptional regulator
MMDDTGSRETSATRAAYLSLREMILLGELPAGQKLKIEQLRTLLNVGASPVREALSLLTSDMLVERIDQRGFRAAPASTANFEEILTLRSTLEDMALRQSVSKADSDWEERLVLSHHRMKRLAGSETFEDAHKSFHMTLLSNAASPMLERYCSQLYDLNIRYRYLAAGGASYQSRDIAAEHEEIFDAAVRGDAEAASRALLSHYRLTGEYLKTQLGRL